MSDNQILDAPLASELKAEQLTEAGKGARLLNYIIDTAIIYVLMVGVVIGILAGEWASADDLDNSLVSFLLFSAISLVYYLLTEGFNGKSPAKYLTRTRVLNSDGTKADRGTIAKRSLCRIIPFDGLSFLGSRGWHDSIPDVVVIKE